MIRAYRPARPSMWRDLRAIPFDLREGLAVLAGLALVPVFSLLLEAVYG